MSSWNDRADRFEERPVRTGFRWGVITAAIVALIIFVGGVGKFVFGWGSAAVNVVSPANVTAQYQAIIEGYESLEAAAANACDAERSGQASSTLIEDPAFAYAAQYRKIAVSYNRRQANIFEARKVGPKGYPKKAPTLKEMQAEICG